MERVTCVQLNKIMRKGENWANNEERLKDQQIRERERSGVEKSIMKEWNFFKSKERERIEGEKRERLKYFQLLIKWNSKNQIIHCTKKCFKVQNYSYYWFILTVSK